MSFDITKLSDVRVDDSVGDGSYGIVANADSEIVRTPIGVMLSIGTNITNDWLSYKSEHEDATVIDFALSVDVENKKRKVGNIFEDDHLYRIEVSKNDDLIVHIVDDYDYDGIVIHTICINGDIESSVSYSDNTISSIGGFVSSSKNDKCSKLDLNGLYLQDGIGTQSNRLRLSYLDENSVQFKKLSTGENPTEIDYVKVLAKTPVSSDSDNVLVTKEYVDNAVIGGVDISWENVTDKPSYLQSEDSLVESVENNISVYKIEEISDLASRVSSTENDCESIWEVLGETTSSGIRKGVIDNTESISNMSSNLDTLNAYSPILYCNCSTASSAQVKEVSVVGSYDVSNISTGTIISCMFTYKNTNSIPKIEVKSVINGETKTFGQKKVFVGSDTVEIGHLANEMYAWGNGDIVQFIYNGNGWEMVSSDIRKSLSSLCVLESVQIRGDTVNEVRLNGNKIAKSSIDNSKIANRTITADRLVQSLEDSIVSAKNRSDSLYTDFVDLINGEYEADPNNGLFINESNIYSPNLILPEIHTNNSKIHASSLFNSTLVRQRNCSIKCYATPSMSNSESNVVDFEYGFDLSGNGYFGLRSKSIGTNMFFGERTDESVVGTAIELNKKEDQDNVRMYLHNLPSGSSSSTNYVSGRIYVDSNGFLKMEISQ